MWGAGVLCDTLRTTLRYSALAKPLAWVKKGTQSVESSNTIN